MTNEKEYYVKHLVAGTLIELLTLVQEAVREGYLVSEDSDEAPNAIGWHYEAFMRKKRPAPPKRPAT